jgi:hypothetical protein
LAHRTILVSTRRLSCRRCVQTCQCSATCPSHLTMLANPNRSHPRLPRDEITRPCATRLDISRTLEWACIRAPDGQGTSCVRLSGLAPYKRHNPQSTFCDGAITEPWNHRWTCMGSSPISVSEPCVHINQPFCQRLLNCPR